MISAYFRTSRGRRIRISGLLLALTLLIAPVFGFSQAICTIRTIEVSSLRGKIVENSRLESPWQNVVVELRSSSERERLISTVTTDEYGIFKFAAVKKGKYFLEFRTGHFPKYRLVVKTRDSNNYTKGGSFVIKLDSDCGKTEVTLGK